MNSGGFDDTVGGEQSLDADSGSAKPKAGDEASFTASNYGQDGIPDAFEGRGGIVTGKGTADGLTIRMDARVEKTQLREALISFVAERKSFLAGNSVAFEWVGGRPDQAFIAEITAALESQFKVNVADFIEREGTRSARTDLGRGESKTVDIKRGVLDMDRQDSRGGEGRGIDGKIRSDRFSDKGEDRAVSLFDGIEVLGLDDTRPSETRFEGTGGPKKGSSSGARTAGDAALWDDPDARIIHGTLRSGQKVESEHSLVIFGDVNSGAEVVAGGDIVVLGVLRGVAHAGAFDETGAGRVILALNLQPTQLRIGSVISRGASGGGPQQAVAEVARVEGNLIVVEPYQGKPAARGVSGKLAQMKKLVVGG